ncbi:MAG: DUF86 domain-containing protein [Candidatus Eisenbacteria sp.]|nr:DUF86 domain-containing protein [Candidatus Eisenbacteria bacterium]
MPKDDGIRIRHMLDAAQEVISFSRGHMRADLDGNRLLTLGLLKGIEIIGEAASRVTSATQDRYPQIPWSDIVGMRNRVVHVYFDIDLDQVWETVTKDVPPLIEELKRIVPAERDQTDHS